MSLSAGDKLGPYEIVAPIGAGGMGEVYKARDTRLDRMVAVKVSNEQFSERFEREARAVAALNHTLHELNQIRSRSPNGSWEAPTPAGGWWHYPTNTQAAPPRRPSTRFSVINWRHTRPAGTQRETYGDLALPPHAARHQ
jgi:serine/threonine protein kinase